MEAQAGNFFNIGLALLSIASLVFGGALGANSNLSCIKMERDALVKFKQGLVDDSNQLLSWVGEDCCTWKGVSCSNKSGHVIKLDLRNRPGSFAMANKTSLQGEIINLSLLNLTELGYLDLSLNNFQGAPVPAFLGSLKKLEYLNLSHAYFKGKVPNHLGNLSSLQYLDLSHNELEGEIPESLRNLCGLRELSLAHNKFSGEVSGLLGSPSGCLQNSLTSLILETNYLSGRLPDSLGNFTHLVNLNLYSNAFLGPIPESIGRLSSLEFLYLSHNFLNGSVPESVGQLSNMEVLDIHNNSLNGVVSEIHFAKLSSLTTWFMYNNSIVLDLHPTWIPPFQIQKLALFSCKVGPQFPQWLRTQKNMSTLEMSNTSISDHIPDWFESISSNIELLDLSRNQIGKNLPKLRKSFDGSDRFIYLYSNKFEGPLTPFPSDVIELDVSNNMLDGHIPQDIGNIMPRLTMLHLSNNSLNGIIPVSLCEMKELRFLDLSRNQLRGRIPDCWRKLQHLRVMDLSSNVLSDHIPSSLVSLPQLRSLHLQNNSLQGKLPTLFEELKHLRILDLSDNVLDATIPSWIGEKLSSLTVLDVHSNRFQGEVPQELCVLSSLRILNLADNEMSGTIPSCFDNFTGMNANEQALREQWPYGPTEFEDVYGFRSVVYEENVMVYIKGLEQKYTKTLAFLASIDLSRNKLVGKIPSELMSLSGLRNLNLSGNTLKGPIPWQIGNMKMLESLDLSKNELSGLIPASIAQLNFLSHLNLSFNQLSGRIPAGNQLQSLDGKSIYIGNNGLCGFPLNDCQEESALEPGHPAGEERTQDEFEIHWFYNGLGMGFVTGFIGVSSILYFKDSWRDAVFQFVDRVHNSFLSFLDLFLYYSAMGRIIPLMGPSPSNNAD